MKFDLTDLRLFCDVVDSGSITAGAERSAIALAAASTRIRGMELSLGAPLLTRSITGIEPLLWASDYPHPEGTYPHSQETVARIFGDLSADEQHAVTFANAARLYDLDAAALTGARA